MPMTADQTQPQTATLIDLGEIFVSLEFLCSFASCVATTVRPANNGWSCMVLATVVAARPSLPPHSHPASGNIRIGCSTTRLPLACISFANHLTHSARSFLRRSIRE